MGIPPRSEGFNRALPREKPLTHFPFAESGPQSCSRVLQLPAGPAIFNGDPN
jgi:hypothetical protein